MLKVILDAGTREVEDSPLNISVAVDAGGMIYLQARKKYETGFKTLLTISGAGITACRLEEDYAERYGFPRDSTGHLLDSRQ